jgi:hypothetical protein
MMIFIINYATLIHLIRHYTLLSSAIRNIDLYHYASLDIYMILAGAIDS